MRSLLAICLAFLSSLLLGVTTIAASTNNAASGGLGPEQRLHDELQAMLLRMAQSGILGTQPGEIRLRLDEPAQRIVDLGLLVDSSHSEQEGVLVLGSSPGSTADRMGVEPGDLITAVNGQSLIADRASARTLRQQINALSDDANLEITVLRNKKIVNLRTKVSAVQLPALRVELGEGSLLAANEPTTAASLVRAGVITASQDHSDSCGRISVFHIAPRSEHLYPATIIEIDGHTPGPAQQDTYRVSVGSHHLLVSENIDYRDISASDTSRQRRNQYKELVIDVAPGVTYMIAARLNPDKNVNDEHAGYWDPVAWKEISESCK